MSSDRPIVKFVVLATPSQPSIEALKKSNEPVPVHFTTRESARFCAGRLSNSKTLPYEDELQDALANCCVRAES